MMVITVLSYIWLWLIVLFIIGVAVAGSTLLLTRAYRGRREARKRNEDLDAVLFKGPNEERETPQ